LKLRNVNKKNSTSSTTGEKTRNYIISLQHDKMSHRSRENYLCENELIIDFGGQKNETKYN